MSKIREQLGGSLQNAKIDSIGHIHGLEGELMQREALDTGWDVSLDDWVLSIHYILQINFGLSAQDAWTVLEQSILYASSTRQNYLREQIGRIKKEEMANV